MKRLSVVLALATVTTFAAACSDGSGPTVPPVTPQASEQAISCQVTVSSRAMTCDSPQPSASPGMLLNVTVGGPQGTYVQLASSGTAYSGTSFTSSVTVQNKSAQFMGTADGTNADANGTRVFFSSGPTVTGGTGTVAVVPDGTGTFTGAGQAYYQYNGVLASGATSAGKTWTFTVPATVTTFSFTVLV